MGMFHSTLGDVLNTFTDEFNTLIEEFDKVRQVIVTLKHRDAQMEGLFDSYAIREEKDEVKDRPLTQNLPKPKH